MSLAVGIAPLGVEGSFWLWSGALFLVTFVVTFAVSLAIVGALLVRLPATYFLDRHERELWIDQHPIVRWSGIILKNVAGVALIALGFLLSLPGIPGQGLLTILLGVMLLDFPGKRRLERRIIGRPRVLDRVNRLRARFGKPPLVLAEAGSDTSQEESLDGTQRATDGAEDGDEIRPTPQEDGEGEAPPSAPA